MMKPNRNLTMLESDKENIDELIAGFLSKGTSPEEEKFLLQWIESDSNNWEYYVQMYRVWASSAQIQPLASEREEAALRKVHRKIYDDSVPVYRRDRKEPKTVSLRNVFRYAAAAAVLLVVTTYALTRQSMNRIPDTYASESTYEAHYGSRAFTSLPDGSKVWLNSGSKLSVQNGYNINERRVLLSGEAYFEVITNPEKPFIVQAGNLSVRATGTTFNVKAYPDEDQITATLVEGVIVVEGQDERQEKFKYKVNPGQTITYVTQKPVHIDSTQTAVIAPVRETPQQVKQKSPISLSRPSPEALTSWMKDRWIIDSEDFGSIAVKLERRYNVEIRFDTEKLKQYHFSCTIERETVEQMFDAFRYTIPLKYSIDKGVVRLSMDPVLEKQYEKAWKQK